MLLAIIYLIGGLLVILLGANWLVDGASSIAKRFNISNIVIGLTIVAFGTSAPEFIVSVTSSIKGNTELAVGNVVGSNIFNILGILGITSLIYPLAINRNTRWKEIPLSLLAALLLAVLANDITVNNAESNFINRSEGIILLFFFIIFMYYTVQIAFTKETPEEEILKVYRIPKSIFFIILGLAGLTFGGKFFVEGAVGIATKFGVSEAVIGLTIAAIGTSLPELATSIIAARKQNTDIAVGNIVGSNIFNIFFILGTSATIKPLHFNAEANFDILMLIIASILLFIASFNMNHKTIGRIQGIVFVFLYILYLAFLITRLKTT